MQLKGRYFVTGAAGFIGSHLCDRLIEMGCEVVGLDNFITGAEENLRQLAGNSLFSFMEQDLTGSFSIEGELAGIFHLACPASPVDYSNLPIETLQVGSIGTENVLKLATERSCPALITSTSEVYGDPLEHPQREEYWGNVNPIGLRSCYDEAKRFSEALTMAYHRKQGTSVRIVRIFNTYGPRMRPNDGRVVPNFCMQALRKEPLTIYGDGSQSRSFCYVDDMVEGVIRRMGYDNPQPINIGNPSERTIMDFAKAVIALTGNHSQTVIKPLPADDPKIRRPDISKAKKHLDWEPKVDLESGLKKTLEYFQSQL